MTDKIDQILSKLKGLETGQKKLHQEQESLRTSMNRRFDIVEQDLSYLKKQRNEDVLSLMEEMNNQVSNLASEIKQVRKTQEEQHHIIELLATRSIEQEAKIKRIP